jgi:TetR/AcrR family transcriptional regulator, transcriptional repressor for nem operon
VSAAAELMFECGVDGTTMEDMRAAAGVSSSQIYHYFTDKEALVKAVIEYQNETIVGGQEPMLARLDTLAGLHAWRDFMVAHQRELNCRGGCPIGSLGIARARRHRTVRGGSSAVIATAAARDPAPRPSSARANSAAIACHRRARRTIG